MVEIMTYDINALMIKHVKIMGVFFMVAGASIILLSYFVIGSGDYDNYDDFLYMIRDIAIGLSTTGLIVYSIESLKLNVARAIDYESFKSIIRSNLKDNILKIDSVDETKIQYEVLNKLDKGFQVVRDIKLTHYLDLKDICAYPHLGDELSHFIADKIKKIITGFNSNQYGLLCPISENNYLATRIAAILEIPVIFVKIEPPDTCNACEDWCLLDPDFMDKCGKMDAELLFDGAPVSGKQYILFDDITLTGDKQCFSAAITKKWKKDINIPYAIILILRKEVDGNKIEKKLMQHVGNVRSIWELGDADIAIIKNNDNS